jgi:hypothetical protein
VGSRKTANFVSIQLLRRAHISSHLLFGTAVGAQGKETYEVGTTIDHEAVLISVLPKTSATTKRADWPSKTG